MKTKFSFKLSIAAILFLAIPAFANLPIPGPHELPDPDGSTCSTDKPVKVYILSGQSNMVGMGQVSNSDPNLKGTLETITADGLFPHLIDDAGAWTIRNDVWYEGVVTATAKKWLTVGCGARGNTIGPELGFGHIMGYYHDEPVIILKASQGNRSINWDFAPPSTERFEYNGRIYAAYGESPGNWPLDGGPGLFGWYAGKQWDDCFMAESEMGPMAWDNGLEYPNNCQVYSNGMTYISKSAHRSTFLSEPGVGPQSSTFWNEYSIFNATDVLDNFATKFPKYAGQGFEIAGFVWWQGNKDMNEGEPHASRYEFNMVNFVKDLRNYFEKRYPDNCTRNAPFVIATYAEGGWDMTGHALTVANGQIAASNPNKHPEFEGSVATVEARDFWRSTSVSPTTAGYHYNGNAETYMLVGDSLGRAMVELLPAYSVNAGDDMITWNGEEVPLNATIQDSNTVASYEWIALNPDPSHITVVLDPAVNELDPSTSVVANPTITITKPAGEALEITLMLKVDDGINKTVIDTINIEVYDDACKATRFGLGITSIADISGNCVLNLEDIAAIAETWLKFTGLSAPIAKP